MQPAQARNRSPRRYRYYDLIMAGFVTILLCSNLIGPAKSCDYLGFKFGAGNLFFPISYIFGDVLTEVYGYARSRKVIWAGFAAMIFATLMGQVILRLPVNAAEPHNATYQPALELIFGGTWRIVAGSLLAFWVGDFANSFIMAKLKLATRGRHLWTRTISSTVVGQGIDSLIFYPIAFFGLWAPAELRHIILVNWLFKVAVEVLFTPLTYAIVGFLKRAEQEDFFDEHTDFSPFALHG